MKSVEVRKEQFTEASKRAEELRKQLEAKTASTKATIDTMCKSQGLFAGVILTRTDLATIFKMAITSGDDIKIPYKLYDNIT